MLPQSLPHGIGRYEIRQEIGRGMMGVVYEAYDPALGRRLALKTIQLAFAVSSEERESFEQRFLAEARIAARLSHPGIVIVHDVGQDPGSGTLFIAFEYLEGRTLGEVVKAGPLEWREALRIGARVADALHHAHSHGVIHRDIKPANIMLLRSGEPKIMDFGIAKLETARIRLTMAGQSFGTPLYMAPEQALDRALDGRADLFSLGAIAYTLLTGQLAFGAATLPKIISRIVQEDPTPPTRIVPSLPREIDDLIARALAKDPDDRYPDGRTLAEEIEDILAGRPPRHRAAWTPPAPAEGTLASSTSSRPSGMPVPAPAEPPVPKPPTRAAAAPITPSAAGVSSPSRRAVHPASATVGRGGPMPLARRSRNVALPIAAALGILGVVALATQRFMGARVAPAPQHPEATFPQVAATPAPPPTPSPSPTAPETEALVPEPTVAAETPPAPYERRPAMPPSLPPPPASAAAAVEPAQLAIDFEHPLKSGQLRIWVDGGLVIEEQLESRVAKKIVTFKLRKGGLKETLELPPGGHEIEVRVAWDDKEKSELIWGHFKPGATRRLEIRVGRLRKNLSLDWR